MTYNKQSRSLIEGVSQLMFSWWVAVFVFFCITRNRVRNDMLNILAHLFDSSADKEAFSECDDGASRMELAFCLGFFLCLLTQSLWFQSPMAFVAGIIGFIVSMLVSIVFLLFVCAKHKHFTCLDILKVLNDEMNQR